MKKLLFKRWGGLTLTLLMVPVAYFSASGVAVANLGGGYILLGSLCLWVFCVAVTLGVVGVFV